jgi:hypothetical protein
MTVIMWEGSDLHNTGNTGVHLLRTADVSDRNEKLLLTRCRVQLREIRCRRNNSDLYTATQIPYHVLWNLYSSAAL